jgi:hypothetical protein
MRQIHAGWARHIRESEATFRPPDVGLLPQVGWNLRVDHLKNNKCKKNKLLRHQSLK